MKTTELLDEAISLPVEERAMLVDSLHKTLNSPYIDIESQWNDVAQHRLREFRSGEVKAVLGEEVFKRILGRLSK